MHDGGTHFQSSVKKTPDYSKKSTGSEHNETEVSLLLHKSITTQTVKSIASWCINEKALMALRPDVSTGQKAAGLTGKVASPADNVKSVKRSGCFFSYKLFCILFF